MMCAGLCQCMMGCGADDACKYACVDMFMMPGGPTDAPMGGATDAVTDAMTYPATDGAATESMAYTMAP